MKEESKIVYLMRGCPGAGKSFTAKKLAGKDGMICETDSFFGPPGKDYHFDIKQRDQARNRNMYQFLSYLRAGYSPVIVDRGCGKGRRTWWYAKTAQLFGYEIKLAEPISPWWKEIREGMKKGGWPAWAADLLFEKQKFTHKVSRDTILRSLNRYDPMLTIKDILREKK